MSAIKILYLEDEHALGQIVTESLENRGFDVEWLDDGTKALNAFRNFKPDLCVLDIMLPNKDGYSIAREIRLERVDIPIIFLTAKTRISDLINGFEAGGNDYLKKPFSLEELIVRINNLLNLSQRTRTTLTESINIGCYKFRPEKCELSIGENVRKLSFRETQLLHMLLQGTGKPVLRKDILLKIWSDDSFFNSRNLDVYISKLRNYLKQDPKIEIVTIRHIGYLLIA